MSAEAERELGLMDQQIEKLREMLALSQGRTSTAVAAAAERAGQRARAKQMDDFAGDLTSVVMTSLEDGGKAGGKKLKALLKKELLTEPLEVLIKATFKDFLFGGNGGTSALAQLFGMNQTNGGNYGSSGGLMSLLGGGSGGGGGILSNISNLYSTYTKGTSWLNTAADWLGLGSAASSAASIYSLASGISSLGVAATTGGTALAGLSSLNSIYALGTGAQAVAGGLGVNAAIGSGLSLGAGSAVGTGVALGGTAGTAGLATGAATGAATTAAGFSWVPIVGWILAGIAASATLYGKGYSADGIDKGVAMVSPTAMAKVTTTKILEGIGLSNAWANTLSGAPIVDKLFDLIGIKGGETRAGGQYAVDYTQNNLYNSRRNTYQAGTQGQVGFLEGPSGGQFAATEVGKGMQNTVTGINGLLKELDSTARVSYFTAGLETSKKGRGGVFSGGTLSDGTTFGERMFESTSSKSPNAQEAYDNLQLDFQQSTLQALKAAKDVPAAIKAMLTVYNKETGTYKDIEQMNLDEVTEVLTAVGNRIGVMKQFREAINALPFNNLKNLSFETAEALINAAGGMDTLNNNLTTYFTNFYSESERYNASVSGMQAQFAKLGMTMPSLASGSESARAQFRALVDAQNVNTEKGRENYTALLALSGAFAELTPLVEGATAATRSAADIASERKSLEMQLLQLQGNTTELRRLERLEIAESNKWLYDAVKAWEDHNAVREQQRSLEEQIWEVTGNTVALRAREREVILDANKGLYDWLKALEAQKAAAEEHMDLTKQVWELTGNTVAIRALERAEIIESNRAMYDWVKAIEDLNVAKDKGMTTLQKSITAENEAFQERLALVEQTRDSLKSIFDSLTTHIEDLRKVVNGSSPAAAANARTVIQDSINTAAAGGTPDAEKLNAAIAAAKEGLASENFATRTDRDRAALQLAGQLSQLQGYVGKNQTDAEAMVTLIKNSIEQNDKVLKYWEDFIAKADGTYAATMSVASAVWQLVNLYGDAYYNKGAGVPNSPAAANPASWLGTGYGMDAAKLPSFDVGTDYVPNDMIAQIHQGERITPAAYNRSDVTNAELGELVAELVGVVKVMHQDNTAENRAAVVALNKMTRILTRVAPDGDNLNVRITGQDSTLSTKEVA